MAFLRAPLSYVDHLVKKLKAGKVEDLGEKHLVYLRKIQLLYYVRAVQVQFNEELQQGCENATLEQNRIDAINETQFKNEVVEFVRTIWETCKVNVLDKDLLIDIGYRNRSNGQKVAFQLIGKEQVMLNVDEMVICDVLVHKRLLEALRWKVIQIFERQWESDFDYRFKIQDQMRELDQD
eukprot:TRINITY_DN3000_c0_g1_i3.p4 TRINITY_DN3000_c0_g1~~TRINITY_DN3000_c0_g1_i3.p4  ORF type:complete len:180 (-),score=27.21 TRINITY_DN3000_c0_g1_i3:224-763(-)